MKNLTTPDVILPLRMGIAEASRYVNRPGRKAFLAWIDKVGVKTYTKNDRGDREYITADLIEAVSNECA